MSDLDCFALRLFPKFGFPRSLLVVLLMGRFMIVFLRLPVKLWFIRLGLNLQLLAPLSSLFSL